jgi:signal transduction histidine kinase
VELTLMLDDGKYRISISDDGVGIAPERLDGARSHGLVGMRHRIESLGGKFTIGMNAPHGTRIEVAVPRNRR